MLPRHGRTSVPLVVAALAFAAARPAAREDEPGGGLLEEGLGGVSLLQVKAFEVSAAGAQAPRTVGAPAAKAESQHAGADRLNSPWAAGAEAAMGVAEALAQASSAAEANPARLRAVEGLWARGVGAEAAAEDLLEDARLGSENAQLRQDNSQLALEDTELQREAEHLHAEDAQLRAEDERLRAEDVELRHALTAAASSASWARRNYTAAAEHIAQARSKRVKPAVAAVGSFCVAAFIGYMVFCTNCFGEADDADTTDSDSDDFWGRGKGTYKQEQRLRDLIDGAGGRDTCGGCCLNRSVLYFLLGVLIVSGAAAAILWEAGVIQPVLANLFMYAYVLLVLGGFIWLLLHEIWRGFRKLLTYVLDQLQAINSAFKTFGLKAKHKCNDLLDDGKLNASVPIEKEGDQADAAPAGAGGIFTFDWMFPHGPGEDFGRQARPKRKDRKRWRP